MTPYEQLREVIQAANPDLVENYDRCMNCGFGFDYCGCGDKRISKNEREIRLADVLLASEPFLAVNRDGEFFILNTGEFNSNVFWNLKDDNLDNQSDETKLFLIDLLVKD